MIAPLTAASTPSLLPSARIRHDDLRGIDLLLLPERVVRLNGTANAILQCCDGRRSVDEITNDLERRYKRSDLISSVLAFLNRAAENGWVRE